jgi:hypothetical protein
MNHRHKLLDFIPFFLFGLWDYWHCGHAWPIVPASGDSEDNCGEQMECRLAGETEVLGENLPQRHFCPSQNPCKGLDFVISYEEYPTVGPYPVLVEPSSHSHTKYFQGTFQYYTSI